MELGNVRLTCPALGARFLTQSDCYVSTLSNPLASEGFRSMATDRVTVRIAKAAILRLEEVLTRSDRPLNPQTRATMIEEVLDAGRSDLRPRRRARVDDPGGPGGLSGTK